MALDIVTFDPLHGGRTLFKALGHPLALAKIERLLDRLAAAGPVGLYDPDGSAASLAQMHELRRVQFAAAYVQDWERVGAPLLNLSAEPVTAMAERRDLRTLFLAAFDAERRLAEVRSLLPLGMEIATLDAVRIPEEMLSRRDRYLDPLNFATNFALFRDGDGLHTRLVTADYWSGYGAEAPELLLILFDGGGRQLADWRQKPSGAGGTIVVDSSEVRRRFGLGPFAGQLFLQAIGAAGHDIVKYVLETLADVPGRVSTTHDANAWPADFYAGLPAPAAGERVVLWLQNAHPAPIPAGAIGLNLMGREETLVTVDEPIPQWGTVPVELGRLLPEARWPQQIELRAGRHLVRPRYEVIRAAGQRRIAHMNVERTDLTPDPQLPNLAPLFGKGFLLPAPILPPARWRTLALPTPMARSQRRLPVAALLFDPEGRQRARISWGNLAREAVTALDIGEIFERPGVEPTAGYGHVELIYDFAVGKDADGWLHGLFRYQDRQSGQGTDTSFGAHIFNTPLVYGGEPHSYSGPPPGLTTRLYLRLPPTPFETFCHLIYPASTPWRPLSATSLFLVDAAGQERAKAELTIPCGGSRLWRPGEVFAAKDLAAAGKDAHVIVRDTTCRLFGYHGIDGPDGAFCLDHMFGF